MGTDAPLLPDLPANGESDALLGGGVLSDVGRARALTSLAGCFRRVANPTSNTRRITGLSEPAVVLRAAFGAMNCC